jgi:glycosyltransferase involved in cell wall biosynthesis
MSSALPRISLVTCSFQQARFLDATLRSVLAQDYPDLDYAVVDGGSTDGSVDIIRKHAEALAWSVSEPDHGQTDALIKGFSKARGDVCGWLCSDDLLLPGALHTVGAFFRDHPDVQAVYGDSIWIDINGRPLRPKREMGFNRFVFLHDYNYIPQPSMFWRRELYERVGGLQRDFDIAMDNDLWEKFSAVTRVAHLPVYLSCMRYYPQQKTALNRFKVRGRAEGDLVMRRGSVLARAERLRPLVHAAARLVRLVQKGAAGGYTASIPAALGKWFEAHATETDPENTNRNNTITGGAK